MKETGLILRGPLVQAVLAGRKTQHRMLVKPQPPFGCIYGINGAQTHAICCAADNHAVWVPPTPKSKDHRLPCPYGGPGDLLFVKETFRLFNSHSECACYDDCQCSRFNGNPIYRADQEGVAEGVKWKPSIFMPRKLSRITLEIVSVRVERLQDIGDEDAEAEGINRIAHGRSGYYYSAFRNEPGPDNWCHAAPAYKELWESINSPGSWDQNPWVWVIEFKEVKL